MFTGITQQIATVSHLAQQPSLCRYRLRFPSTFIQNLQIGASISVQGVCQSVVAIENDEVTFDAISETLQRTTLSHLVLGQKLNVERAAKIGDEIGGHWVSGHIFGTAIIEHIVTTDASRTLTVRCNPDWMKYILHKGFIAINGVSLTIGDTAPEGIFQVHLIPETLRTTTFGDSQVGEKVNIEIDSQTQTIVDTVERVLANRAQKKGD